MPYDLSKPLVIGISSRALFNLEQENKIFEEQGVEAYEAYQVAHENENLQKRKGVYPLMKHFSLVGPLAGKMLGSMFWFFEYRFTILPVLLTIPVFLLLGWLIPCMMYDNAAKCSVVEQLRDAQ